MTAPGTVVGEEQPNQKTTDRSRSIDMEEHIPIWESTTIGTEER